MPRVGISALTLVPGVVGGSEVYVRELARTVAGFPDIDLRVFTPAIAHDVGPAECTQIVSGYRSSTSTPGRLAAMTLALASSGRLGREMNLQGLDVLHYPLSVAIPRVDSLPTVTSLLDVQHEHLPEFFSRAEIAYRRRIYAGSARRSERVITISQHAADAIHQKMGIPEDRIRVIHLGVDHARFAPGSQPREHFILYPANPWPHKNHQRLFEALRLVRKEHPRLRLVLTGSGHARTPRPAGVEILGRVSSETLADLYQRAAALVYPSLYEGFGMPVLEAMASGCPVAASNVASIPEVAGDAAVLFDPYSPESIAQAIRRILCDPAPLVARGLARAQQFTWARCAEAHAAVYRELTP